MPSESEILCLEVCPYKSERPILVAGVYRPPSSKSQDDINIGNNIENAYLFNKELIILGILISMFSSQIILNTNLSKH